MTMDPKRTRGTPKRRITASRILVAVREAILGSTWDALARTVWCRKQRRRLGLPGHSVVWVRGDDDVRWAEWGNRHGYFEVERMNGLAYLRAVGAPVA